MKINVVSQSNSDVTEANKGKSTMINSIVGKFGELATCVGEDIVDGAWLTVAHDATKTVRELITRGIAAHFDKKGESIIAFLNTDQGTAALSILLGMIIPELPIKQRPSLIRLSKECRRFGWFKLTSLVTDPFFREFIEFFNKFDGI